MENMSFPRPFADRYGVNLTIAILAISPFIVVTTAAGLYRDRIAADLGAGSTALVIIAGLSIAGYAFGAMLGGYFIRRFPLRPLYFACEALCIGGCLLAALADGILTYGGGRVLFGFATGQLLVTALPPVIQRFPPDRMPFTAIAIDIGFFGAVTIGPLIGGVIAHTGAWRGLYGSLAGICAGTLTTALFTLPDRPAFKPDQRFDALAILLAFAATFLPFWATGELASHGFYYRLFAVPLAVGLVCLVVLLLTQYHQKEPLSPVKPMWHSYPIVGTMAAMFGGGAYITLVMLAQRYQLVVLGRTPLATG
ncbi:MAG: MFS transporter, partial [Deltaproteobacteria bacterium]